MIAYVKGIIEEITDTAVHIEANGIGYEVISANPFIFQSYIGKEQKIYTFHYVREDTQVLYGFKKPEEKTLFSQILNVSGIGPKGALAILASTSVKDFVIAIEQEDEKFLTGFPGVGKKTARQMILDLKGKLPFQYQSTNDNLFTEQDTNENIALQEAKEALKTLGYSDKEIKQVLPIIQQEPDLEADVYIRKALAQLMK
ncbi:Holliday junction branch migration protein RuvA [Saliterribacillus persicus]|uniref:Holliday junction branch migration complex subunit RuvA n=1 Tax=Saliterribacillus persicus TaxID=930114 RepID=A0A368XIX7_9BACI|nr:Holliday junction branch migration protein RuvA [Saliterribacillus persicus]RCW66427.1 Holliday junction DNA helicase subunit RuvA [Saliterribacillus persicus]